MKRVKYNGKCPEYCDGFPKDCKRSCKGAIHLLPTSIKDITDDEYKYIKKAYPKLKLLVVPKEKPSVKKVKVPTASKAQKFHKEQRAAESEGSASKKKKVKKKS